MALFLFLLARAVLAYLLTAALFVVLRPLFSFRQAQYAQVFPLKSVSFCKLSASLGSTCKCAIFLLFFSSLTLALFSPSSFLLQSFCPIWENCLLSPPLLSGYNGSPDTRFSQERTRLISWPNGSACSLSPLTSRIHSYLFSDWGRTVSSKFCDFH